MPGGRPRALDKDAKSKIIRMLDIGHSRQDCADYHDISVTTIADEMKRDQAFSDGVKKAEIGCKSHHLTKVHNGAPGWQASMTFLERKWYKEYSRAAWDMTRDGDSIADILKKMLKPKDANAGDNPTSDK